MNINVIKCKIYVVIIGLLIFLLIIVIVNPKTIVKDNYTYMRAYHHDIKTYELAFKSYLDYNNIPEYLLNKHGEALNRALIEILTNTCTNKQYNAYSMIYYKTRKKAMSSSGTFVDPWGTPYCFRIYNDNTCSTGNIDNVFLMWSCGSNLINDYGTKDDINSWESYEENCQRIKMFKLWSNVRDILL